MSKRTPAFAAAILAAAIGTGACVPRDAQSAPPSSEETAAATATPAYLVNPMESYQELLADAKDTTEICDYINAYIKAADQETVQNFIAGLLSYTDDLWSIDFSRLEPSRPYFPKDMQELMTLAEESYREPPIKDGEINLPLSDMLDQVLAYERLMTAYPQGTTAKTVRRVYERLLEEVITGGYDPSTGTPNYYEDETGDGVDRKSADDYQSFLDNHGDSLTAVTVRRYLELLEASDYKIDEEIVNFYDGLADGA